MMGTFSENDSSGDGSNSDVDGRNVTEHRDEGHNTSMTKQQRHEVATVTSDWLPLPDVSTADLHHLLESMPLTDPGTITGLITGQSRVTEEAQLI